MNFGVEMMLKSGTAEKSGFPLNPTVELNEAAAHLETKQSKPCTNCTFVSFYFAFKCLPVSPHTGKYSSCWISNINSRPLPIPPFIVTSRGRPSWPELKV